ncbi:LCP family protein [Metabacillus halosaccharovorans]|uniref:LCP family protein n=1 Tax=Metabacillus halosaccharovorans TaxID=930124 RepID=A0ABT3DCE7_9BACI|nr:LCP family protein [Metabacillus halosaccharovorans]MCV9884743.1 LCP family protein [Metabacillus halosaccharovorans]
MNRKEMKRVKKKRRRPILRRLLFFTLLLLIGIGSYVGYVFYQTLEAANNSYDDLGREKSKLRESAVNISNDPVSILLLGVEDYSSGGAGGRSDTLMLATLNPKEKTMKLISIPRDTKVEIPGEGEDKINHSYSKGGKELTIETVEDFLDIPIDYYATVNFNAFKDIINEVDGVVVDVPFDFWEKSEKGVKIYFEEGRMNLNGVEALAYARMRKRDPRGDFGRNERQQQIITALVDKVMSPNNVFKIDDIAKHVGNNVETNMAIMDALGLQQKYSNFNSDNIDRLTIEGTDEYESSIYYFIPDEDSIDEIKKELKTHLEINSSSYSTNTTSTEEQ